MNKPAYKPIPKEKFTLTQIDTTIYDEKFSAKPIGYLKDAFIRFRKNKASVVAAIIIICIVLFAVITQFTSDFRVDDVNGVYSKSRPKIAAMEGKGFWDGGINKRLNDRFLIYYAAISIGAADTDGTGATWEDGEASEFNPLISIGDPYEAQGVTYRDCRVDSYDEVGFQFVTITRERYDEIRAWDDETGIQAIYPMIDTRSKWMDSYNETNANFWYRHDAKSNPVDKDGNRMTTMEEVIEKGLVDNYLRDSSGNIRYYAAKDKNMLSVRVLYYNYFQFTEGKEPLHALGTDSLGYDILIRLSSGILLSLALAISVSAINLTIGTIYGAIEGYYGGLTDLLLERIVDILSGIPFIIVAVLFQLHLVNTGKVSAFVGLLFAYVLTGWIGTAGRVRTQFYRFKNQEYIMAARTLGAKDSRLMFKHIFPNALGTIITSSVMVIPGVILSEAVLSYIGIVNLNSRNVTSLGTMLNNGQNTLSTDPHIILFPALVISLLMISFNLFGNGLRDAFNPSLRGTEE